MKITALLHRPVIARSLYAGAVLFIAAGASAQNLLVSTYGGQSVEQITPGGSVSAFLSSGLSYPNSMVFDSAGDLFIGSTANNSGETGYITKITPGGTKSTFASGIDPHGLAFNSAGNLLEVDYGSGNIYEYTPGGVQSTFLAGLPNPLQLAFNNSGDLFVTAGYGGGTGFIDEIMPGGGANLFATGLSFPNGIAINKAGDVFVSSQTSGAIYEYTPGGVQSTFVTLPTTQVNGLTFDSAGDLFAAASSGGIYEITPGGGESTFASIAPTGADQLVFQPAPEPSTLALLAGGVSTVMLRLRRKK
jgi:sugar lactone lactonase YvrE